MVGPILLVAAGFYAVYYYLNLEPVRFPGIERKQFVALIDPQQLHAKGDAELARLIVQMPLLHPTHPFVQKCNNIVAKLIDSARRRALVDPQWSVITDTIRGLDIQIIVTDTPNLATCMASPSGKIVLFSGLMAAGAPFQSINVRFIPRTE
jgi:hypothetical protein